MTPSSDKPVGHAGPDGPVGALAQAARWAATTPVSTASSSSLTKHSARTSQPSAWRHDGEGLPVAPLAPAQLGHRLGIVRVAHKMKAPQPLHGQNLPFHEHLHRRRENGIRLLARLTERAYHRQSQRSTSPKGHIQSRHRAGRGSGGRADRRTRRRTSRTWGRPPWTWPARS